MTPSFEKITNFIMPTLYTTGNQVKVRLLPSRVCEFLLEDAFCSQTSPPHEATLKLYSHV